MTTLVVVDDDDDDYYYYCDNYMVPMMLWDIDIIYYIVL
jgi:hypothetical protein